ncbi:MAG: adenylate/guanylate cyclase domain-containing protein [Ferrovibrionaceae bacterium]
MSTLSFQPDFTLPEPGFDMRAIYAWLIQSSLAGISAEGLFNGFCERLAATGFPLARAFIGLSTLHPLFRAHSHSWRRGGVVSSDTFLHSDAPASGWNESPFRHMLDNEIPVMRRHLTGPEAVLDFAVLAEFRDEGYTDWLALAFGFGFGLTSDTGVEVGMVSSWAVDRPEGMTEAEVETLVRLVSTMALAVKGASSIQVARNVLDTYIGTDAADRVLNGDIQRGSVMPIRAVLLYADLRNFTGMTDSGVGTDLIAWLDDYLDCMGSPVQAHGGQVLKFLGDGMLATFALDDGEGADARAVCSRALAAATEAFERVAALNHARAEAGLPCLDLDIALHLGEVFYGNVGTASRLDFTVIGPAVNEAARIEALCKDLDHNLLVSAEFAGAAAACGAKLVSLGHQTLRGVREPKEIFTLSR